MTFYVCTNTYLGDKWAWLKTYLAISTTSGNLPHKEKKHHPNVNHSLTSISSTASPPSPLRVEKPPPTPPKGGENLTGAS